MFQKIGKFTLAFLVTLALFFAYGILTLGNMSATGKTLEYIANKTIAFSLGGSKKVDDVYINVGAVYAKYGDAASIEIEYTTATTPNTSGGTDLAPKMKFANIYAEEGKSGYNYNWCPVVKDAAKNNVRYLFFRADTNLALNEIVCLDENGNVLPLTAFNLAGSGYPRAEVSKAVDAQDSFKNSSAAYDTLTQEEGYYMTSVNNFLLGGSVFGGSTYNIDENYNGLATVLMAPSVAIFGDSAFALRLTPFLATCVMLAFLYLLAKDLFRSEKWAYLFMLTVAFGGLATTVGRMGTPLPLVLCTLVISLYFAYRFFSHGVRFEKPLKGCMPVLVSGLFAALAIAMETLAVIPVLGIVATFILGLRRVKKAKAYEVEKAAGDEAAVKKIEARYAYTKRASIALAVLSYAVGTLVLLLLGAVVYYSALVKAYDTATAPSLGFLNLFVKGIVHSCSVTAFGAYGAGGGLDFLSWFIPLKNFPVYAAHTEGAYLAWETGLTAAAKILALLSFVGCAVRVVCDYRQGKADRLTKRFRRIFFVLVGAAALTMIAALIKGGFAVTYAYACSTFGLGFIPLALTAFEKKQKTQRVLTAVAVSLLLVFFILNIPTMYGFAVPTQVANALFGWTTIL